MSMKVKVREYAPDFKAQYYSDNKMGTLKLSDYLGQYVVLFFYPLDFTFVCPTEIIEFNRRANEFRNMNCQVMGCSIDSKYAHMEYSNKPRKEGGLGGIQIPLISDIDLTISKSYGVYIDHPDDPERGVDLRATFIIDSKGLVRHITLNDLPVGRDIDSIIKIVEELQYTDEYGDHCQASYFKNLHI